MLNVLVTYPWIMNALADAMGQHGITPAQYNVLRILRGAHPERVACSYIGERLLDRTPDVTRLLDRLERAELIHRRRAEHDRRVVEVSITDQGLLQLDQLQKPVDATVGQLMSGLRSDEQKLLSSLLEKLRQAGGDAS